MVLQARAQPPAAVPALALALVLPLALAAVQDPVSVLAQVRGLGLGPTPVFPLDQLPGNVPPFPVAALVPLPGIALVEVAPPPHQ